MCVGVGLRLCASLMAFPGTCVSELPADIKGKKKDVKEGRRRGTGRKKEGDSGWREIRIHLFVVIKSVPYSDIFYVYVPAEFRV